MNGAISQSVLLASCSLEVQLSRYADKDGERWLKAIKKGMKLKVEILYRGTE